MAKCVAELPYHGRIKKKVSKKEREAKMALSCRVGHLY